MTLEEKRKRLSFSTVRENWNEYKLIDTGSLLNIKVVLKEVVDIGQKDKQVLDFKTEVESFKEPLPDDKGEPSKDGEPSFIPMAKDELESLNFERISEPLNIYDIPNKFLFLLKPVLDKVEKSNKFDKEGNRIYLYDVKCAPIIVEYPKD
ncbi:MAG: hypothetical protein ABSB40_08130 [Nitrososphaeria archaeon]|jgi:hypothetical protein